jgi:hypothetical protein
LPGRKRSADIRRDTRGESAEERSRHNHPTDVIT